MIPLNKLTSSNDTNGWTFFKFTSGCELNNNTLKAILVILCILDEFDESRLFKKKNFNFKRMLQQLNDGNQ